MDPSTLPLNGLASAADAGPVILPIDRAARATATTRVLHLVNGEHYSGAERVQDLLAKGLTRFGFEVGFACLKPGKFPGTRQAQDAPLLELPMRHRLDWRVAQTLAEWIASGGYQLIHAHTPRGALVGRLAAARAKVPLVYHVHSPAARDSTQRWFNWLNAVVERQFVRHADRLICVSPSLKTYMVERGFAAERVVCVPNGVPPIEDSRDREPPEGTWTLGTVALFRPRKGLEVLLQSLAALHSRGIDVRLRAVGPFETPEYESAIMCLVERLGIGDAIDWIGFTQNVPAELQRMDAFVLPSLFGEGLPMVVLESLAAGVPVVATRVEGVPLAVVHRETGLLTEPGSVSQLSRTIEQLVSGEVDYAALSHRARKRHAERFSDSKMAEGVAEVYRQALDSRC